MKHDSYNKMLSKADRIKEIRILCNTILANGCYHTKEVNSQLDRAERTGNLTDEERETIQYAWDYRNKLAHELIEELKRFINYENQKKTEE